MIFRARLIFACMLRTASWVESGLAYAVGALCEPSPAMGLFRPKTRLAHDPRPGEGLQPRSKNKSGPEYSDTAIGNGTIPAVTRLPGGPGLPITDYHAAGAAGRDGFYTVNLDSPEKRSPSFTEAELVTPRGSLTAWLPSAFTKAAAQPSGLPHTNPSAAQHDEQPHTPRTPRKAGGLGDPLRWQPEAGGTPRSVQVTSSHSSVL